MWANEAARGQQLVVGVCGAEHPHEFGILCLQYRRLGVPHMPSLHVGSWVCHWGAAFRGRAASHRILASLKMTITCANPYYKSWSLHEVISEDGLVDRPPEEEA